MNELAFACLIAAAIPAALYVWNRFAFQRLPNVVDGSPPAFSVLIPARNEELSIEAAVRSALASEGAEIEVIVLDDSSADRTAEIVNDIAQFDSRVRVETAPPLPPGWCGKQAACRQLARLAKHDLFAFLDADVRLEPDALARLAAWQHRQNADLVSAFPRQETGSPLEWLLIPQIHSLLLGFLPVQPGRWLWRRSAFAAGCGQLFLAQRAAYEAIDGHAAVKDSLHDGLKLPKAFRAAGFRTDIADGTDIATCRMYRTGRQTWLGLAKNAREGLASIPRLPIFTVWLALANIVPVASLPWMLAAGSPPGTATMAFAIILGLAPRIDAAIRFRQKWVGVVLHPVGVTVLLALQWWALFRGWAGRPVGWKGRAHPSSPS